VRYEQKTKWYRICHFSSDYTHYSHEKVMVVVDVQVWNMVEIYCCQLHLLCNCITKEIVLNLLGSELITEVGNYLQLLLSSRTRYILL
jgi:hypothetical protein